MSGRHEKEAIGRLQIRARVPAVETAHDALADLLMAGDVLTALKASADLLLALEAMAEMGSQTCKALRAVMAEVMGDTGATAVDLAHHRVALVDGKQSAIVTDPAALPPRYMVQLPPKPDLAAILRDLKAGPVPGAQISNGGSHIRITPKKDAA